MAAAGSRAGEVAPGSPFETTGGVLRFHRQNSAGAVGVGVRAQYQLSRTPEELLLSSSAPHALQWGGGASGGPSRYHLQPRPVAAFSDGQQQYLHRAEVAIQQARAQAQAQAHRAQAPAVQGQAGQGRSINTHEVDVYSHSLLSTSPAGYFNFAPSTCLATSPHSLAALGGGGGTGRRSAATHAALASVASPSAGLRSTPTGNRSLLLRSESIPEGESLDMGNEPSRAHDAGVGAGTGIGASAGGEQPDGAADGMTQTAVVHGQPPPDRSSTPVSSGSCARRVTPRGGGGAASNLTVLMERQERQQLEELQRRDGDDDEGAATAAANAAAEALAAMALEGSSSSSRAAAAIAKYAPTAAVQPQPSLAAPAPLCHSPHRSPHPQDYRPSPGPGRVPLLQRARHTYSPAGISMGGSWAPASLPNALDAAREVLPSAAAAAAAAATAMGAQHGHGQYLIPPPQPALLPPHPTAMAGFASCSAGRSAPSELLLPTGGPNPVMMMASSLPVQPPHLQQQYRRISAPILPGSAGFVAAAAASNAAARGSAARPRAPGEYCKFVRRCVSNRELGDISPPPTALSTSPYAAMLYRKEVLEAASQQRLMESRLASLKNLAGDGGKSPPSPRSATPSPSEEEISTQSSVGARQQRRQHQKQQPKQHRRLNNEARKNRRAQHNQAVIDDLCEIVADLFIAEKRLLHLTGPFEEDASSADSAPLEPGDTATGEGGVDDRRRVAVLSTVRQFLSELPPRYALGVETPSAVLVHMRLMAAARADDTGAAVHIANMDEGDFARGGGGSSGSSSVLRLVTISCADCDGLLEFITKLLGTGGARVLDADVMLTTDCIVLDRFVVEMKGRLRLDKLQQYIENYLKESRGNEDENVPSPLSPLEEQPDSVAHSPSAASARLSSADSAGGIRSVGSYGPLYFNAPKGGGVTSALDRLQEEMQTAVPLSQVVLGSANTPRRVRSNSAAGAFHRQLSAPLPETTSASIATEAVGIGRAGGSGDAQQQGRGSEGGTPSPTGQSSGESGGESESNRPLPSPPASLDERSHSQFRRRRQLVNRAAVNFGADDDGSGFGGSGDNDNAAKDASQAEEVAAASGLAIALEQNQPVPLPLIPFDELMLIETLGSGRVSTIYRAAWQPHQGGVVESPAAMVALKVATVDPGTGGMEHVEELRREADIASMLEHNNICSLIGVASDPECFCLAYEFCEGGSLLSLLSNSSRCYEYLPIALDIANGMAYLHSRNVIHRDLKPSNILLTRDNRAKIADFGMSVTNFGQELTAETGTYRWMAPEVIRHESYSSNADVYSFGVVLWQLITREVPFATLSPIQTAYAVAEGCRPDIPTSTPEPLQRIIRACWDEDSHKRPSFTYIAMALADYAKMAFNPANVGAQTVRIANEMLASVEGNSTVNVDFTTPVTMTADRRQRQASMPNMKSCTASFPRGTFFPHQGPGSFTGSDVGLQI